MSDSNTWISISALVISVIAFIHTFTRSISQSKLEAAQLRSDLLTRIIKLKLEYEQEINHLYYLSEIAQRNNMAESKEIFNLIKIYQGYVKSTQEHYNGIFKQKTNDSKFIVDIGHHIDSLRAKVESETRNLQEQRNKVEKLTHEKA